MTTPHDALLQCYVDFRDNLRKLDLRSEGKIEPPLLMAIPERWATSPHRILVVGQETLGWDMPATETPNPLPGIDSLTDFLTEPDGIAAMQQGYRDFAFALHQPENFNSPYWGAHRQLRTALGEAPTGFDSGVLTTNLFKTAINGESIVRHGTAEQAQSIWQASQGWLTREIEILQPTAVLFLTGPDYDPYLDQEFPGLVRTAIEPYTARQVCELGHPALPALALRTYHPGYLSRGHWEMFTTVLERLAPA